MWVTELSLLHLCVRQVELAEGKGVKVATILEDPKVMEADRKIYASHTKSFLVKGSGFVSIQDPGTAPTILLDGISSSIYMIQVCTLLPFN